MRKYILFLVLIILVFPELHLFAQIDDITRLPTQNTADVLSESAPVIISENEVIILKELAKGLKAFGNEDKKKKRGRTTRSKKKD